MEEEVSSLSAGINLIPQTTKKPQQVRRALALGVLITRYILIAVAVIGIGLLGVQIYLSQSLQNTSDAIAEHITFIEEKEDFQDDFIELQTYASVLAATHSNLETQSEFFVVLEEITPKVVVLTDLTINEEEIRISGRTTEYPAITDYFDQIVNSESFNNVQILNIIRPTENDSDQILFTIAAEMQ